MQYYDEMNELNSKTMTVGTYKCVSPITYQAEINGILTFKSGDI